MRGFVLAIDLCVPRARPQNQHLRYRLLEKRDFPSVSGGLDRSQRCLPPVKRKDRLRAVGLWHSHPFKIPFEKNPLIASGRFFDDAGFFVAHDLLDVEPVLKEMPFGLHPQFKLLRRAVEPAGKIKDGDVTISFSSQEAVPATQIPEEREGVEDRTLAGSIRTAKDAE